MSIENKLLNKNKERVPETVEAYRSRKIEGKVRRKYTIEQEVGALRQKDSKPEKYQAWFDYVEQCIAEVDDEAGNY